MEGNEDIQQDFLWISTMINQPKRWDLNRRRGDQAIKIGALTYIRCHFCKICNQKKMEVCSDIHVSVGSRCSPQLLG